MKINKKVVYVVVPTLLALLCIIITHRYLRNKELSRQRVQKQNTCIAVSFASVDYHAFRETIPFTGSILAVNRVDIKAEEIGHVSFVAVREGDCVKQGSILAQQKNDDLNISLQAAEANLSIARIKAKQAKYDNDRAQKLLKDNSVSYQYAQQLETVYHTMIANVHAAESSLSLIKNRLHKMNIIAPFSGEISQRFAQPGELLMPGQLIFSLVDNHNLEIQIDLPADIVNKIQLGMKAYFQVPGFDRSFTAIVRHIYSSVKRDSRTLVAILEITNSDGHLKNGMFTEGAIFVNEMSSKLALPSSVLNVIGREAEVFVIDERHIACRRKILVGADQDGWRPVYGVDVNTKIVANNSNDMLDGMLVHVTNTINSGMLGQ